MASGGSAGTAMRSPDALAVTAPRQLEVARKDVASVERQQLARIGQRATVAPAQLSTAIVIARIANADVRFDRGVPVFPRRPGAPTLSVEDVDRLADGVDE